LYDVNPPEGFNLRRDVYMRMAVFVRKMKKLGDWHLVRCWRCMSVLSSSSAKLNQMFVPYAPLCDVPF